MNILTIIPARCGSKGVPKKNIKRLYDKPLIAYSINTSLKSEHITRTIVSTDCDEIAQIAKEFGAEVPFLRPTEFAMDKSLDIEYISHALEWLQSNQNYTPDFIVLLRPTTPIRDVSVINNAINLMINNGDATSLRSSHQPSETPYKWFRTKGDYYIPVCDNQVLSDADKPRQSFEKVFIPNGYVDIIKPSQIKLGHIYGDRILCFETQYTYEIDTNEDFEYIEYLLAKGKV